ncbi:MAG: NB-ARC domain-containing protein [Roseiflexaceae bacterium]|nr:NB-ARC domain-containing protein [Roseiflexaceae bacterium]
MNREQRAHLRRLLELHRAHLRELELQAAKFGDLHAPTHILLQIAEYQHKIAEIEDQMKPRLPHNNLPPRDYDRFVGRQHELADLQRLLNPRSRAFVVTIDGIGGIGKSALALEVAHILCETYDSLPEHERFAAIVWVSAKRSYLTADGILERRQSFRALDDLYATIAQVLDYQAITRARIEDQHAIVEQVLGEQRTLLILDNLETVDDDALMVFLRELPNPTKAIVTTRHRIDVAYPIRLSGMPHADALLLCQQEAARKQVALSAEEQEQLWQRTGGVPLAIVWSIGLMGLGGSVESVLRRLSQGQSDIARFCFEASITQIRGRDAHTLLLALSLFTDDANRAALGVVAGLGEDEFGRDRGLEELLTLSLINKDGERFSILPLTQGYIQAETLHDPAWNDAAIQRWIDYYDQFVNELSGWSVNWRGHEQVERELANIFGVFHHLVATLTYVRVGEREQAIAQESIPQAKKLLRIFDRVGRTCRLRGHWTLIETEVETALRISRTINSPVSGWLYYLMARISFFRGDIERAKTQAQEMLIIAELYGDENKLCRAQLWLGLVALNQAQLDQANRLLMQAWESATRSGKSNGYSLILAGQAQIAVQRGNMAAAMDLYQQAIQIERQRNDLPKLALLLLSIGQLFLRLADLNLARQYFNESLQFSQECGWAQGQGEAALGLASIDLALNRIASAEKQTQQALSLFRRLGMKREQAAAEALLVRIANA